jgi:hypothetical protein
VCVCMPGPTCREAIRMKPCMGDRRKGRAIQNGPRRKGCAGDRRRSRAVQNGPRRKGSCRRPSQEPCRTERPLAAAANTDDNDDDDGSKIWQSRTPPKTPKTP